MKKVYFILIFTILFLLFNFSNVNSASNDIVENNILEFQNKTKCKSLNVVVYDNGKISYYGNENSDLVYQIGSLAKSFTGLGIMKLIQEGKATLNSNISLYIPNFEAYYKEKKEDITIKQLLTHRSGFNNSENAYPAPKNGMSLFDWVNEISGRKLQYKPGDGYSYSNVNYNLLGFIIEKLSGKSYKEYMEEEILKPLKLNNTYVGKPVNDNNVVKGSRLGYWNTYSFDLDVKEATIPSGYFYSNITDMCRWIEIWLGVADIPDALKK